MRKRNQKRLIAWALPAAAAALALIGTTTLLAQGAPKGAKKPAAKKPAAAKPIAKAPEKVAAKPLISPKEAKLELAKVGEVTITVGDLAERINRMSRYVRGRYQSIDKKKTLLESMLEFEVLAKEAERRGFAKHPDVVRMLRQVMIQRLRQKVVEDKVTRASITDEVVKAYYEKHKTQYNKPETIRVSHILLKDQATAQKVFAEVKAKGSDPRAFRALVKKYSQDPTTQRRAGDLRYFTREDKRIPKPLIEASFKLQKRGDVGGPVKTANGWHIIKLTHRRQAINRQVDDAKVKQQIVTRIMRDERRKALESYKAALRTKAQIKIYDDRLASVKIDATLQRGGGRFGRPGGLGMGPGRMGGMRRGRFGMGRGPGLRPGRHGMGRRRPRHPGRRPPVRLKGAMQ